MNADLRKFEEHVADQGAVHIAGVDEAGRGPLAGPVVAAAVILPKNFNVKGINDSKKLSPGHRDRLYTQIYTEAVSIGIGILGPQEIDQINILQASLRAMVLAINRLLPTPDFILVDGNQKIPSPIPQLAVIKGDSLSISIAAGSIIAKVTRDRIMHQFDTMFPKYGFTQHKGYPTKAHKQAIAKYGVSPIHRRSYKGVREYDQREFEFHHHSP